MTEMLRKSCLFHFAIHVNLDGLIRWWYARDVRTGREGVVPAAYLY